MRPLSLYVITHPATTDAIASLSATGSELATYRSTEPLVRAGLQFAGTVLVSMVVLGLLQGYGTRAVTKSRRSPVISICIGLPSLLVVAALASTGYLIVDTSIGTFFGIPLVVLGTTVLPIAAAIGVVAIGHTVASRLGADRLWIGVLTGAALAGIAGLSPPATVALAGLAASLGIGASVRVVLGTSGAAHPDDRTVPPANKI